MSAPEAVAVQGPATDAAAGEWNWKVLLLGVVLSIFFAMSSTYVGLYAGMTISASIPAAVLSVIFLRRAGLLEHNIVQTAASAGESLAAGVIFTMPALLVAGVMTELPWWLVTSVALFGGLLGIIAMIWIRRPLIVERDRELTYPEGRACARMLQLFARKGASLRPLVLFGAVGAAMKALTGLFGLVSETASLASVKGTIKGTEKRILGVDSDISLALVAVGVIIGFNAAMLVLLGGLVNMVVMPAYALWHPDFDESTNLVRVARFLGIGTMVVSAFYSLVNIGVELVRAELRRRREAAASPAAQKKALEVAVARTDEDMKRRDQALIVILCTAAVLILYQHISGSFVLSATSTLAIVVASGFFALVASYTVGQVGSTSNPVSGMTISGLLFSCLVLLPFRDQLLALEGGSAKTVLLTIAGVVCCAACTAGAVSQDLKTGWLLGATPRRQQWAMLLGTAGSAFVLQPLLMYLHRGYGIGQGLRAPQANVFKEIVEAFLRWLRGENLLYADMILVGMAIGVALAVGDAYLKRLQKQGKAVFRLYPMATAVGIYLGMALAVPVAIGGFIALYIEKKIAGRSRELPLVKGRDDDEKNLDLTPRREYMAEVESHFTIPAAGLIAGEAIVGIVLAVLVAAKLRFPLMSAEGLAVSWVSFILLLGAAAGLLVFVLRASRRSFDAARARAEAETTSV